MEKKHFQRSRNVSGLPRIRGARTRRAMLCAPGEGAPASRNKGKQRGGRVSRWRFQVSRFQVQARMTLAGARLAARESDLMVLDPDTPGGFAEAGSEPTRGYKHATPPGVFDSDSRGLASISRSNQTGRWLADTARPSSLCFDATSRGRHALPNRVRITAMLRDCRVLSPMRHRLSPQMSPQKSPYSLSCHRVTDVLEGVGGAECGVGNAECGITKGRSPPKPGCCGAARRSAELGWTQNIQHPTSNFEWGGKGEQGGSFTLEVSSFKVRKAECGGICRIRSAECGIGGPRTRTRTIEGGIGE